MCQERAGPPLGGRLLGGRPRRLAVAVAEEEEEEE